jgi:PAS domain S-box-containing protein
MEISKDDVKRPNILVVDDQAQNILLIREYLDKLDIDIEEANSGMKCLEMLENKIYTLLILDIQMPGMDGFEVLAEMRKNERLKEIPVVFISAIYDSDKYVLKGIESGAIDFIAKPVNISILRSKVSNFLKLYEKQDKLDQLVKKLEVMNNLLQVNERKLKRITQSANDSIIVLDSNYRIAFWNKASREIFGYVKYEILAEDFFSRLISVNSHRVLEDYFKSLLQSTKAKLINTITTTGVNKLGKEFPIELSLSFFTTATKAIYYTVIIRDITLRVTMEKEALKAKELFESNRLMKEFMDNVSHELRTPMNAILGISNMLLKYNSENLQPKQIEGLQIINQSGTRLLDLVNDVLDLSKIEENKITIEKEKFDLEKQLASLRSMVYSLIGIKNIKFHINKSSNVPDFIYTDQKKLNQVLINLLGNAVKFTNEGRINLFIHLLDDKLYFEVNDTGVGIAEENLDLIFEKFRQIDNSASKEYKGTGLGLHISKKLVEMMGGEIKAESKLGVSTTMKFYIHSNKAEIEKLPSTGIEKETFKLSGGRDKVSKFDLPLAVIIEDNEEINYWYSSLLRENGYETISCYKSSIAFRTIKRVLPDLIILKYEMPKMHGHFLLNQIGLNIDLMHIPMIVSSSLQNLSLPLTKNPFILLSEPILEKQLLMHLKKIREMHFEKHKTQKLILFEKENHLEDYITDTDECFKSGTDELAYLMLARRKVSKLILDGMDINGENLKIIYWLQMHKEYMPDKVYTVIADQISEKSVDVLNELPNHGLIKMESIIKNNSLEMVLV